MNVLITSASRKVLLVEAFQAAVGHQGSVVAAEVSPFAAAAHCCDAAVSVPPVGDKRFVDVLLELCRSRSVDLVVPTSDNELSTWATSRQLFESEGVRVHVPQPATVELCQDKRLFQDFCQERGHPVPNSIVNPTAADLPMFSRPRRGSGGHGAQRIDSLVELSALADQDHILTTWMDADEYTIDVFIGRDLKHRSAVPRRRIQVVGGESFIGQTVDDPELVQASINLCLDIGIEGHATVQAFRTPSELWFIEINPRFGGGSALSIAAGADSPRWLVQEVAGEPLDPVPGTYRPDLVMLRYGRDIYLDLSDLHKVLS